MKLLIGILVFVWVLSGLIGAWRLGDLDMDHLTEIAKGPITLADAFDEYPVTN
jgi:hypothetical protein